MRRYLLPPMLNTVQEPTGSACGKSFLVSGRFCQLACRVIFHQSSSGCCASGCFAQNSRKGFLLIMCNSVSLLTAVCSRNESNESRRAPCVVKAAPRLRRQAQLELKRKYPDPYCARRVYLSGRGRGRCHRAKMRWHYLISEQMRRRLWPNPTRL